MRELERIAVERTLAGQRCALVHFSGAHEALLVDFDGDGQVVDSWTVPAGTSAHEDVPSADD